MYNNPLGKVIRDAFIKNVLNQPLNPNPQKFGQNTIANILRHKRISLFEQATNKFITSTGLPPIPITSQFIDERNLLTFSLQLSGYIRDAQQALAGLKNSQAYDPDLISLYRAAAKYSADCTDRIDESKYVFREHCDYNVWKIQNTDTLSNAFFMDARSTQISPERHNLFLFMPFHIKGEQSELQKWSSKYLNKVLDNPQIFSSQVDVWLIHFPIEQPRGEKFALSLETIRNPQHYFEDVDMRFVKQYFSSFLGENIVIDNNNKVVEGVPHDAETFKQLCQNITTIGYCAGGTHAVRWLNAFSHIANQLYDKQTVTEALQNIYTINYAFLPSQKDIKSSGIYFMSNYGNDTLRKEPFIKMFNPELYEAAKYIPSASSMRTSVLPDSRNYIIAFKLPEDFAVLDSNHNKQSLPDIENGHHMGVITARNANSASNFPLNFFTTVVENASIGYRGDDVFRIHSPQQINRFSSTRPLFVYQQRQKQVVNG